MKSSTLDKFLRWFVVILIPIMLTLLTVRFLISWDSPSYPEFEYQRIASDRYGFDDEDRLRLALATLDYLRDPAPADEAISELAQLRLPDSENALYNAREIGHMIDVKKLVDLFNVLMWVVSIIVVVDLAFLLSRQDSRSEGYKAIFHGGLLTVSILLVMLVLIIVSWNLVFTQFHELLFPPETWTFYLSDSLIRLFPEQFWFDFGLIWAGAIFLEGIVLTLVGYILYRNRR